MRTQEAVVRNREQQIKDEVGLTSLMKTTFLWHSLIYNKSSIKLELQFLNTCYKKLNI